ncbi:hypothetical protein EYC59_03490 [Candidatus Saccharibacteria bacterium]|nr:MAG: hypothetical protein EYC59_03490 [Candidatus Saccharibacteria bacterium]
MKQGGGRKKLTSADGFTIVETLIVLLVSVALFSSAALLINGKQSRTAFQTGTNNLQQRFQQLINQMVSGYYPGGDKFTCTGNPTGAATGPLTITNAATEQGSNGSCMFVGTVAVFNGPGQTGDNADKYTLFALAGNRVGTGGVLATTYRESWPTAIAKGNTYNSSFNGTGAAESTEAGLTYVWGAINGTGNTNPSARNTSSTVAVAILSNLDGGSAASGLDSGAQQFGLYGFNGWPGTTANMEDVVDAIDDTRQLNTELPASVRSYFGLASIELCYASSGTNQSALFSISKSLTVSLDIKSGRQC